MKQRKKSTLKRRLLRYLKWSSLLCCLAFVLCWWVIPYFTPIPDLAKTSPEESTIILDRDGLPLHHATREDYLRHRNISFEELPETLIQATLAAEDKRFWNHKGVDLLATSRSVKDALTNGKFVSGASTISQQTIKLISPKSKRTISTKITEAFRARRLEMTHDKNTILETYFNHIEYGNRTQGPVHAAAYYFDKPLDQLSLAEYALLAGIPQAPTRHNPRSNPEGALKRRNWVLERMAIVYQIPADEISRAQHEPLSLASPEPPNISPQIAELFADEKAASIQTTLSKKLQSEVKKIAQRELQKIEHNNVNNAAVVIIDNATGEILSLLGSPNFDSSLGGQYNAALIPRSPGSALKPFTYLLSFQHRGLNPATIIPDIPTYYAGSRGAEEIVNYDRKHHGPVTISHALGNSLNIPAVRVLNQSGGPQKLLKLLQRFGITTLGDDSTPYGLSLAIGGGEVTLLEITNAYACLARGGIYLPTTLRKTIQASKQIANPEQCFLIADILSNNSARSATFGTESQLRLPFRCAVKTGTSTDYKDNFCAGFTKDYTVGVWVGNVDNTPMKGISGVTGAGPIFHETMLALHKDKQATWLEKPESIHAYHIDPHTGKQLDTNHPRYPLNEKLTLLFQPPPATTDDYDTAMRPYLDQRFDKWIETKQQLFAKKITTINHSPIEHFRVLSPANNATYLLDPDLPNNGDTLTLKANSPEVQWKCDTLSISENKVTLTTGKHTITAENPYTKQTHEVTITVEQL